MTSKFQEVSQWIKENQLKSIGKMLGCIVLLAALCTSPLPLPQGALGRAQL